MFHFLFIILAFVTATFGVAAAYFIKPYGSHTVLLALGSCVILGSGVIYFHGMVWRKMRYAVGQHELACDDLDVSSSPWATGPTLHEAVQELRGALDLMARDLVATQSALRDEVRLKTEITERDHRHRLEVEGLMEFLRELRDADDVKEIHLSEALKTRLLLIVGRPIPDRSAPSEMPGGGL